MASKSTGITLPVTPPFTPGQGDFPLFRLYASFDDYTVVEPAWSDLTSRVRSVTFSRGRNSELEQFDAGSLTVVLDNRDRALDPSVVANVTPMNRVWLFMQFDGKHESGFFGYSESWQQSWPGGGPNDAIATLNATDHFKVLNLAQYAVSGTATFIKPALIAILDAISSNAPRRLDPNNTGNVVPTITFSGSMNSVLDTINQTVESDFGTTLTGVNQAFFIGRDGATVYLSAAHRTASPYNTTQATFGDAGGSELQYTELELDDSDSFLFNNWTVNGSASSVDTSSDAASIARYGQRANSKTVLYDLTTVTGGVATQYVAKYKDPQQRVISLSPNMADTATASAVLSLDLLDRIRILRTPPGGGARIDETVYIQRIEISATPGVPPTCKLGVSPL